MKTHRYSFNCDRENQQILRGWNLYNLYDYSPTNFRLIVYLFTWISIVTDVSKALKNGEDTKVLNRTGEGERGRGSFHDLYISVMLFRCVIITSTSYTISWVKT